MTLISKIDHIKNFGIYKNFNWSNSIDIVEFSEKNIIYGWNYSGKTTFSRIFSALRDGEIFSDYPQGEFKLTCSDNTTFSTSNLNDFPNKVLVFNSDYVRENLRWELDDEINAIYFDVGDKAKRATRIEELEKLIIDIEGDEKIKGKKEPFLEDASTFNAFDETLFTNESRRIKNDVFSSLIDFNKSHFKKQIPLVLQDLNSFLLKETEVSTISKTVKIEEPKPEIDLVEYDLGINSIINSVNGILENEPKKSDLIPILEKNSQAFDWVQEGLTLNKTNTNCLFCDNLITSDRMSLLNKFYENEGSKLKEKSKHIFELIDLEKKKIEQLKFPSSIQEINEGFQESYLKKKNIIDKKLRQYTAKLNTLTKLLKTKINKQLYNKVNPTAEVDISKLKGELADLNKILKSNNAFSSDFQNLIQTERLKFINHLVAKYLKDNKYQVKKKKHVKALEEIEKLGTKVSGYKKEIDRLRALNNSGEEGCQQFNFFIQSFLSKEDIEIKFDRSKEKFTLHRGNEIARNLSEGEKMAISFSHFLVTLKSIDDKNELKEYILFIDDPMSSLDGNHIFQINALLKDFLYTQVKNPQNPSQIMWQQKCLQLFISTHNYEFFNLLKEMPTIRGFGYEKKNKNESRYFISRKVNESSIEKLPAVYDSFKSEYHFLFKEINDFNENPSPSKSDRLLLMPNILRRFLEIYTLAKYPSKDEVDERATEIFGPVASKRICKPFHYFSHFNNIDRIGQQSEFLADIGAACEELIKQVKKDRKHYKALKSVL
ncbi:AAA family ATPase [Arenibacter algicola]|uniref:AAA domain protein n=1 Tax=Arenibacter algicola TaxID=616991 RepID=A0A221UTS8_9FLAO|nr:AAA family ATPase [Arenibacter algicola]ASO04799.1 AAA domain protein [Arenibacter algicola]